MPFYEEPFGTRRAEISSRYQADAEAHARADAEAYSDVDADADLNEVCNALALLLFDPQIRGLLEQHDPKAVEQARAALGLTNESKEV